MPAAAAVATCIALFTVTFDYREHHLGVSDGTSAGTETILRIRTPAYNFTQTGKSVVFVGKDRDHGSELWVTDGTGPGTRLLKDINEKPRESSDPGHQIFERAFATSGRRAIFPAEDATHGREMWATDGTAAGTRLLKDINKGRDDGIKKTEYYGSDYVAGGDGKSFFLAHERDDTWTLWSTAGTRETTQKAVPETLRGKSINHAGTLGTLFLFSYEAHELWKTGGTTTSARLLKDFGASSIAHMDHVGQLGYSLFAVQDRQLGTELWTTDGTAAGTVLLRDIEPGRRSSNPGIFFDGSGFTLFSAETSRTGRELWVTRGDPASTRLLIEINPGRTQSSPYSFARLKDRVVFSASVEEGVTGRSRLFITDGTPKGTRQLSSSAQPTGALISLGDRVLFQDHRSNQAGADEIWMTRGEPDDEVQVSHFGDANPNFSISNMAAAEVLRDAKRATPCPD